MFSTISLYIHIYYWYNKINEIAVYYGGYVNVYLPRKYFYIPLHAEMFE